MPPEIDNDKCIACRKCANICSEDVFFSTRGKPKGVKPVISYPEACFHCNLCVEECPVEGAIWLRTPLTMFVPYK